MRNPDSVVGGLIAVTLEGAFLVVNSAFRTRQL